MEKWTFGIALFTGLLSLSFNTDGEELLSRNLDTSGGVHSYTIAVGDNSQMRNFKYYVPSAPETSPDLVFVLHGLGVNIDSIISPAADGFSLTSPMHRWIALSEEHGFIVVVPEGTEGNVEDQFDGDISVVTYLKGWNDCRGDSNANPDSDDVLFIRELIALINTSFGSGQNSVFVTGSSNGGHMAIRLAIELSHPQTIKDYRVTAAAPILASMPKFSECVNADEQVLSPPRVPIVYINGTDDPITPYEGGITGDELMPTDPEYRGEVLDVKLQAVPAWTSAWQVELEETANPIDMLPREFGDQSSVIQFGYALPGGTQIATLYEVLGGGHLEPSNLFSFSNALEAILGLGEQNNDIETADEVWSFFQSFEDDADADGIIDSADNCMIHFNPDQNDTDADGYGNRCDADLDNSGFVNNLDSFIFQHSLFTANNLAADFDGDDFVTFADLYIYSTLYLEPPGPSCCSAAQ